jgi:hypothetical protein
MHNYPWRDTCHGVLNLIKDTNMRNTISPLSLPTKNLAMKRRDAMLTVGLIFSMLVSIGGSAQVADGKHQKLFDLYVLGEFEDCLKKAERLSEKDKYKSDSEVYLWISMCNYEICMDNELSFYHKNCQKDALKNGVKFKKKDDKLKSKEEKYLFDQNVDYITKLKEYGCSEAKSYYLEKDYRKAAYYYNLSYDLDQSDDAIRLMKGVADLKNRNYREGQDMVDLSLTNFKTLAEGEGYTPDPLIEEVFEDGFVNYADHLLSQNKVNEAIEVAQLAVTLSPQNAKFIRLYKIVSEG